jgi:hypothetical protein
MQKSRFQGQEFSTVENYLAYRSYLSCWNPFSHTMPDTYPIVLCQTNRQYLVCWITSMTEEACRAEKIPFFKRKEKCEYVHWWRLWRFPAVNITLFTTSWFQRNLLFDKQNMCQERFSWRFYHSVQLDYEFLMPVVCLLHFQLEIATFNHLILLKIIAQWNLKNMESFVACFCGISYSIRHVYHLVDNELIKIPTDRIFN